MAACAANLTGARAPYKDGVCEAKGILDPAFLKPVQPVSTCRCTKNGEVVRVPDGIQRISVEAVLEMLMEVEATIFGATDAEACGWEKEDLKTVLNRYILLLSKVASQE